MENRMMDLHPMDTMLMKMCPLKILVDGIICSNKTDTPITCSLGRWHASGVNTWQW